MVSFQYTEQKWLDAVPHELAERDDVRVLPVKGEGLSANRNHALRNAQGDVLLIADDDLKYLPKRLEWVRKAYVDHASIDFACFQLIDYSGASIKDYPYRSHLYQSMPKGFWFSSCEITMRRSVLPLYFDERFGLGAPFLGAGEEEVFLWQAYQKGHKIKYFPFPIAMTNPHTTGEAFYEDPRLQRSKGAVLYMMHGTWGAMLRCLKFALFHANGHNPYALLKQMWRGIFYVRGK